MANHREKNWMWQGKKHQCAPGEFITSISAIATEAQESERAVRTALSNFADKYDFLTKISTRVSTKITILNWKEYQLNQDEDRQSSGQTTDKQPTTNKNDKNIKEFSQTSDEVRLSNLLFNLMKKNNPGVKKPNIQSWAKLFDMMIRVDKRHPDAIERLIALSQADEFWRNNILSPSKLRIQFDQLTVKLIGRDKVASEEGESLPPGYFQRPLDIVPEDTEGKI